MRKGIIRDDLLDHPLSATTTWKVRDPLAELASTLIERLATRS